MIQFKRYIKESILFFKEHIYFSIVYVTIMFIVITSFIIHNISFAYNSGNEVSIADCFIFLSSGLPLYINFIILPCVILFYITKNDFKINNIIRYVHLKKLWIKHCLFVLIISLINVALNILIVFIFSAVYSNTMINFDKDTSVFAFINNGKIIENISFARVFIIIVVFCLFVNILFSIIYVLLNWVTNYNFCSFIVILALSLSDIYLDFGISEISGVYYDKWIYYNEITLFIPLVGAALLFCVGYFWAIRKDFVNAR